MHLNDVVKLSCFLVLLLCLSRGTSAIECYDCSSDNDPRCGDPFDPYTIGMVNCSLKPPLEHLPGQVPKLCRKTTQKIFGKTRVIRGCGYIESENDDKLCLRRTGTFEVVNYYCSCTSDLCNAVPSVHQSTTIFVVAALIIGLIATFKRK